MDAATPDGADGGVVSGQAVVETITVRDFNPLDGSRGTKVYASGVGLIQDAKLVLTDERDVTM